MSEGNGSLKSVFSITNILVSIALAVNGIIFFQLADINNKLFVHLTNASIHIPRESIVSKDEFIIYQMMRDKQISDIKDSIKEVKEMICEVKSMLKR